MMKKKAMTNKQSGGMPIVPQGYKNGGKVKAAAGMQAPKGYRDGGIVWDCTQGTGVRSMQDYKK